ncbi:MAG: OmpA family protein [Flavobacteriales bacterium]
MKQFLVPIVVTFFHSFLWGQDVYTIKPLFDLNSKRNELACVFAEDKLIVSSTLASDKNGKGKNSIFDSSYLLSWSRGTDFSDWTESSRTFKRLSRDVQSVTFNAHDSVVYFSSATNYDGAYGTSRKIYSSRWNGKRWMTPVAMPMNDFVSNYESPFYEPSLHMLIFSSNRSGGQGGMDIWYVVKTDFGWSDPVNLGLGVNTPSDEIAPTYHNGDIYYATNTADTWGGFDIRRAIGKNQWRTAVAEGAPINSAADDIRLLFLNGDRAILTSSRAGGMGGNDLYLITREPREDEKHTMTATVECGGQPLAGRQLTITNSDHEIVSYAVTNARGALDISALKIGQAYSFMIEKAMQASCNECMLVLRDAEGNRIKEVRFNSKGIAELELLPFKFSDVNPLAFDDGSLLNLSFDGQLYKEQPGDIGRGEPITILNSVGEAVAIAYTNDVGKFRFTKLNPQMKYVMRLSDSTNAAHAIITDKGEKIDLPVLGAEVEYLRMKSEDAITLINEFNDTIQVCTKDLFVINRIYYDFNSAQLTNESHAQLDQLALIMERNQDIHLELRAHTDSRGEASYNLELSKQRASSAVRYVVSKGISSNRFQSDGVGEGELINECADGTYCSEPEHAINRRTEIRLKHKDRMEASKY